MDPNRPKWTRASGLYNLSKNIVQHHLVRLACALIIESIVSSERRGGNPEMGLTSAFFGSVKPEAFCQKRLKLSFPAPFLSHFLLALKESGKISAISEGVFITPLQGFYLMREGYEGFRRRKFDFTECGFRIK